MHRFAFLSMLLLVGCGTTEVPLAYAPTVPLSSPTADPLVSVQAVVDGRGGNARVLGDARGTLGTATRRLVTRKNTVLEVHQAFAGALLSRGMLAPIGRQRYDLTVRLVGFSDHEQLGPSAQADFAVSLTRHDTGRVVYQDEVKVAAEDWSLPSLDSLAFVSTADVSGLTEQVMNQAIDQSLDKPAFRAALRL